MPVFRECRKRQLLGQGICSRVTGAADAFYAGVHTLRIGGKHPGRTRCCQAADMEHALMPLSLPPEKPPPPVTGADHGRGTAFWDLTPLMTIHTGPWWQSSTRPKPASRIIRQYPSRVWPWTPPTRPAICSTNKEAGLLPR